MIVQFSVTVSEAKRLIAKGIAAMPAVRKALSEGKVFLKGGTTVSALSEELGGPALRVSGRISPFGCTGAAFADDAPHCLVFERGVPAPADGRLEEVIQSMGPLDVAVLGANLVDRDGRAAMLAASPLGGPPGRTLSGLAAQGVTCLIACGLEKFYPGRLEDAIRACGRARVDTTMGAPKCKAVGLMPVYGEVFTEVEACASLAIVSVQVVARGGVFGAEGGTTMVASGEDDEVTRLLNVIGAIRGATTSGSLRSLASDCPNQD